MANYNGMFNESNKKEITLMFLIKLLFTKIYWILLFGVIFALIVYFVITFCITPTYESRVSFYVYNNSSTMSSDSGTINPNDLQAAESLATTYSEILGSNSILDAVLMELGNDSNLERKDLSQMVTTSVIPDTQLLEVIISSNDAELSCRVANAFVKAAPVEIERITKAGSLEIVDHPEVAKEKAAPRTMFDTILGFFVGAIASSGMIIFKAFADTTIYLPEDISGELGAILLGQIPSISRNEKVHFNWKLTNGDVICYDKYEEKES